MNEFIECKFLEGADICPECNTQFKTFRKYTCGTLYAWIGWCDKCVKSFVPIEGNTPNEKNIQSTKR